MPRPDAEQRNRPVIYSRTCTRIPDFSKPGILICRTGNLSIETGNQNRDLWCYPGNNRETPGGDPWEILDFSRASWRDRSTMCRSRGGSYGARQPSAEQLGGREAGDQQLVRHPEQLFG